MSKYKPRVFHHHPATLKEELDRYTPLELLRCQREISQKHILAFQPVSAQFKDIDWSTLDADRDLITVKLPDGNTAQVAYSLIELLE